MKLLALMLLLIQTSHARWMTPADLDYSLLNEISEYKINANGTYELVQTMEYEILKEKAKERFSIYPISYASNLAKVSVIEAKVTNNDVESKVQPDKIVDRTVTTENGISDNNVVQIPLPNLHIGSRIFIKYKMVYQRILVPGHFSVTHMIGENGQAQKSSIIVDSAIPLKIHAQDPTSSLEIKNEQAANSHKVYVSLKSPYFRNLTEEHSVLNKSKNTLIKISTDEDWKKIGANYRDRFEKVLKQPLPKDYEGIVTEMTKLQSLEEKVDYAVSYITKNFNYVGDWRTINGKFSPRELADVSKVKYGDCKDFSVLLTGLLRKSGIQAHIAVVLRSNPAVAKNISYDLPTLDVFNHAIVRVQSEGQTYWIDPTNEVSFGLNHRQDIAGARALPLDEVYDLTHIPEATKEPSEVSIKKVISFNSEDNGSVHTEMSIKGTVALMFTGIESKLPKEKLNQVFMNLISNGEKAIVPVFSPYDLASKKYNPISITADYEASELSIKGEQFREAKLPALDQYVQNLQTDMSRWEGDVYIGEKSSFTRITEFKGIFAQRRVSGCHISTDWIDLEKKFDYTNDGIVLSEKMVIKESFIPSEKFKSTDFELLQSEISDCIAERTIAFKLKPAKHVESELAIEEKFAKLPLKERVAKRFAFVKAIREGKIVSPLKDRDLLFFLKKNIEEYPSHLDSHITYADIVLHLGYYNGYNYNRSNVLKAKQILLEAMKISPESAHLKLKLVRVTLLEGDKDGALKMLSEIPKLNELKDNKVLLSLVTIYKMTEQSDLALKTAYQSLKSAQTDKEKENSWFSLAGIFRDRSEYEACNKAYDQVLKYNPNESYTYINSVYCLTQSRKFDEAVARAKKGREITKAGMMMSVSGDALVARANFYMMTGKMDLAENDFKESLRYSNKFDAYENLAMLLTKKSNYDAAIALMLEGGKYFEGPGDPGMAFYRFSHLLKKSPDHQLKMLSAIINTTKETHIKIMSLYEIGDIYRNQGKQEEFKKHHQMAMAYTNSISEAEKKTPHIVMQIAKLQNQANFEPVPVPTNVQHMPARMPANFINIKPGESFRLINGKLERVK